MLQRRFASVTRARTVQLCIELATTKKRDLSAADYFRKVKGLATDLAAAGAALRDDEIIAYLFAGLGSDYDPFVTSMTTKAGSLTLDEVYAHLMAFEAHQLQHQAELQLHTGSSSSAYYAGRGGALKNRGGSHDRGRGCSTRGGAPPHFSGTGRGSSSRPPCQICGKVDHTAIRCWYRMVDSYQDNPSSVAMTATTSYKVDPNWYTDMGAIDHITSDLDRLAVHERYTGGDTV
jgi:hypothetical protein